MGNSSQARALNIKSYVIAGVAVLTLVCHPMNLSRPLTSVTQRRLFVVDLEGQAGNVKGYFPAVLDAASQSGVDARLVAAVIVVESWNRPAFRRLLEVRVAEMLAVAHAAVGTPKADFSLGPGQMRLTTALWVKAKFRASRRPNHTRLRDDITDIESVAQPRENIRLVAEYIAHLAKRRYGIRGARLTDLSSDQVMIISTEYHIGIRPLNKPPADQYGEIVAELARSDGLAKLLAESNLGH
jgi:hypothetical protein